MKPENRFYCCRAIRPVSFGLLTLGLFAITSGCGGGGGGGGSTNNGGGTSGGSRSISASYDGEVAYSNVTIPASTTPQTLHLKGLDGSEVTVFDAIVPSTIDASSGTVGVTVINEGTRLLNASFGSGAKATIKSFNSVAASVDISTDGITKESVVLIGTDVSMVLPPCQIGPWKVASSVSISYGGGIMPFSFSGTVPAVPSDFNETTGSLTVTYADSNRKSSRIFVLCDTLEGFDTPSLNEVVSSNPQTVPLQAFADGSTIQNLTLAF